MNISIVVNTSNPSSPNENGIDSNENSSSAMDQAMAATLAAIEIPETINKNGRFLYEFSAVYLII